MGRLQTRGELFQQHIRIVDLGPMFVAQHRRHADFLRAYGDHSIPGHKRAIDHGRVGTQKRTRLLTVIGYQRQQHTGRQAEIVRAESDRSVLHSGQGVDRHLELDLGLGPKPANLVSRVHRYHIPAAPGELFDQRVPPREAAVLVGQSRTSTRFDVSILSSRENQNQLGFLPTLEQLFLRQCVRRGLGRR